MNWNGLLGPKDIPQERMGAIQSAVEKVYAMQEWKDFLSKQSFQPFGLKGDQFKAYVDTSDPTLKEMIEEAGLMRK